MAELNSNALLSDANLVSYWRLEGNSNDSKSTNNGTDTGITYNASYGKFGQGALFVPASSSKINFGTASALNPVAVTYTLWIYVSAFTNAYACPMARDTVTNSAYVSIYSKQDGRIATYCLGATGGIGIDNGTSIVIGNGGWHHIAMTYSSADGLRQYVDGQADGTGASKGNLITSTTANLWLGNDPNNTVRWFDGYIDDVALFNRVLTAAEILSLYTTGSVIKNIPNLLTLGVG